MRRVEAPRSSACIAVLGAATALVYANSLSGVFVFDDLRWIVDNDSLGRCWPPWAAAGGTLRPLLFWTLALNRAASGLAPWSYHVVNVAVHGAAAMLLFLIVRDGLQAPRLGWPAAAARRTGLATALLWAVHPLNTQAVTYVIQRGESLAGLWCLVAVWSLLQAARHPGQRRWDAAVVLAWWLALATKESAVALPVVLLAVDVLALSGSPAVTWRRRRSLHLALWVPAALGLAVLVSARPGRVLAFLAGDADGVGRWQYAWTQVRVVAEYLELSLWPHPLRIDHGWPVISGWRPWPAVPVVGGLLAVTARAAWRRRPVAILGAWFGLWLAPTSTLVPLRDAFVEHRMYLPLATVVLAVVLVVRRGLRRAPPGTGVLVVGVAAVVLGGLTVRRNADYASELSLFADASAPAAGARRFYNLQLELVIGDGGVLDDVLLCVEPVGADAGRRQAVAALRAGDAAAALEALAATPPSAARRNLQGVCRWQLGDTGGARGDWQAVVAAGGDPAARVTLAVGPLGEGDTATALAQLRAAVAARPSLAEAQYDLGTTLARGGQLEAALPPLMAALALRPRLDVAANNLGAVRLALSRPEAARRRFDQAAARGHLTASLNLGLELLRRRRYRQALPHLERVLAADAGHVRACNGRAVVRYFTGDFDGAAHDLLAALQVAPGRADLHNNLACVRFATGHLAAAEAELRAALRIDPVQAGTLQNLGKLLFVGGRPAAAARALRRALQLRPDDDVLRANLRQAEAAARRTREP